jgi:hypothetical protein
MEFSDFPVETGIPMPDGPQDSRYNYKYPWRQMNVGDSFFIAAADKRRKLARIRSVMFYHNNKYPEHFEARIVDAGVRVWRTE